MMAEGVDTPTAILANAAAALRENPFDDISYRTLGDAVGVSERTVYRHFPTRSHLLEGVAGRGPDRIPRAEPRRAQGHQREAAEDHEPDDGAPLPPEPVPPPARHATRIRGSTKA